MARAIAIETSGRIGSVAAVEDGIVLGEREFPHGLHNAALVLPLIDELCRERRWKPADVRELYVSVGPGSFTGLRIGVTLAKTLAFATGAKIVAVPTVRVLARNAPLEANDLAIVLDAKRDQIFTARFDRRDDEWFEVEVAHLDRLEDVLGRAPRPLHLLGEGLPYHQKHIPVDDAGIIVTPPQSWRAQARHVAFLGHRAASRGDFIDPFKLVPTYIRLPEAEEKWLAARA